MRIYRRSSMHGLLFEFIVYNKKLSFRDVKYPQHASFLPSKSINNDFGIQIKFGNVQALEGANCGEAAIK